MWPFAGRRRTTASGEESVPDRVLGLLSKPPAPGLGRLQKLPRESLPRAPSLARPRREQLILPTRDAGYATEPPACVGRLALPRPSRAAPRTRSRTGSAGTNRLAGIRWRR